MKRSLLDFSDGMQNMVQTKANKEKITLFHASKSGLSGKIRPSSRIHCDFGPGFYMTADRCQPLTLVCSFDYSALYTVVLDLSHLNILYLRLGLEWVFTVAYYRGKLESYRHLPLYRDLEQFTSGYDVVVGPVVDDCVFIVLDRFFNGEITDDALIHYLSALDPGCQYAAVTEKACENIQVTETQPLTNWEKSKGKDLSETNRRARVQLVDSVTRQYRHSGWFFDEIIDERNGYEFIPETAM